MLKQSYIPHLKVLMCGINTSSYQWFVCIFILCYNHLNLALLLHKTVPVNFPIGTTVPIGCTSACYENSEELWLTHIYFLAAYVVMGVD